MKVYISGPMTGRPGHNEDAFARMAEELRLSGYEVVSPAEETIRIYGTWEAADAVPHGTHLIHDLQLIGSDAVDAVAVMDDWLESKGSRREVSWALDYGKPIYDRRMRRLDVAERFEAGPVAADPSGAVKADVGKTRLELLPTKPLWAIAEVLTFGAVKYADHNWRKGFAWSRMYGAMQRHLTAWMDGEDLDRETGKSHLWHAGCDLMFLIEYEMTSTGTDDRFKPAFDVAAQRERFLERYKPGQED